MEYYYLIELNKELENTQEGYTYISSQIPIKK